MTGWFDEEEELRAFFQEIEDHELSPEGIAESDRSLLERQRLFRRAADVIAAALSQIDEVEAVALFGSVAVPLRKEIPRFRNYRRARIELWHECNDLDLAIWLSRLDRLRPVRQAINRALPAIHQGGGPGVASHQVDVFVMEPGTERYLGRLCQYKRCPAYKRECRAVGCGATPYLQQHDGFELHRDALAPDRSVRLYERGSGIVGRATDLPTQDEDRETKGTMAGS